MHITHENNPSKTMAINIKVSAIALSNLSNRLDDTLTGYQSTQHSKKVAGTRNFTNQEFRSRSRQFRRNLRKAGQE
ncbi:MAG: hypothetical protein F6J98_02130 [Moorea sp. SIO4G2]|nr:hypothetical protein [Moorena sp. SIO4G2]